MRTRVLTVGVAFLAAALAAPVQAKAPYVKKAQEAGHKDLVANCQSCHKAKLPSKKDFALNDTLGAFIDKKMKEPAKPKEMDFAWLKEYKPKK